MTFLTRHRYTAEESREVSSAGRRSHNNLRATEKPIKLTLIEWKAAFHGMRAEYMDTGT